MPGWSRGLGRVVGAKSGLAVKVVPVVIAVVVARTTSPESRLRSRVAVSLAGPLRGISGRSVRMVAGWRSKSILTLAPASPAGRVPENTKYFCDCAGYLYAVE